MIKNHRRSVLKGLAITLPAAWSAPLVKAVVLPVHAQTSQCEAPEMCYTLLGSPVLSFSWPGGSGPYSPIVYNGTGCGDSVNTTSPPPLVVASSAQEAKALLSCPGSAAVVPVAESLPGDCHFYACPPG